MKSLIHLSTVLAFLFCVHSVTAEVRATWIARDQLTSKETLAAAMDRAASNRFNTVYVNAWSRGYPLWRSQVFSNETGVAIDPSYSTRDIMAEAVAEGHRNGLQVFAWFEYGFVGGWTGYFAGTSGKGKIFDMHPDWVAQQDTGAEIDSSSFYWMIHTHPGPQQFLINLAREVTARYDLDGVELDRIRYSSLSYGYDSYTRALYAAENGGQQPPANTSSSSWIRWRATKLNEFHANAYDSIKSLYPRFIVGNAPSAYSSSTYTAYNNVCQDWVWWVTQGKVDAIELQSYVSTGTSFSNILNFVKGQVTNHVGKISPSFALKPNNVWVDLAEIPKYVDVARSGGFGGQACWYHADLTTSNHFALLSTNRYATVSAPSYLPADWREYRRLTLISNTVDAVRAGSWVQSANAGFAGPSFYANQGALATMDYYLEVPIAGIYEIYAYMVVSTTRATNSMWTAFDNAGPVSTNLVDQTLTGNARWYKIGDSLLSPGRRRVLQLSNQGIASGRQVSADAVMISLNRRLSETPTLAVDGGVTNGVLQLRLGGNVGQKFQVQSSTNLLDWTSAGLVTLTNASTIFQDNQTINFPRRFFRVALTQ
jgi:uncharacterized lipoprotein YddW (UPF0748 family)